MSRQALRETILTESQLQDSEKHKQSAVVWSGLSCDTEASHHRHPLFGFLSLLSVYWSFGWSNVCLVWSTVQAWVPLQQPHANSCYHHWLRWHFYQRTNTNRAEIDKYKVSFITSGPLFCLQLPPSVTCISIKYIILESPRSQLCYILPDKSAS